MKLLKQSTTVTIKLGPFLDSTDGVTAETALTLSQGDIILFKNFGAGAQKNDSSSATHDTAGWYGVPLNTTDTGTLGPLQIHVNESGALPVFDQYLVVPANIYDSFTSSTLQKVDLDQIKTSSQAATNLSAAQLLEQIGTVDTTGFIATSTEFETSSITTATADHWIGRRVYFSTGTLTQQGAKIVDYALVSGRGHFTMEQCTSAPANGVSFIII